MQSKLLESTERIDDLKKKLCASEENAKIDRLRYQYLVNKTREELKQKDLILREQIASSIPLENHLAQNGNRGKNYSFVTIFNSFQQILHENIENYRHFIIFFSSSLSFKITIKVKSSIHLFFVFIFILRLLKCFYFLIYFVYFLQIDCVIS